jgi:shikimate kinase
MAPLIFLIGFRGSGKTTVAQLLAQRLAWSWRDADAVLEEKFGRSIRAIFADEGENSFRDKESEVLTELSQVQKTVVATGGGVVLRPANRALLRSGFVVWLSAAPEILHARISSDATTLQRRPPLAQGGLEEVREMLQRREPLYQECANLTIDTSQFVPEDVVERIMKALPS